MKKFVFTQALSSTNLETNELFTLMIILQDDLFNAIKFRCNLADSSGWKMQLAQRNMEICKSIMFSSRMLMGTLPQAMQ